MPTLSWTEDSHSADWIKGTSPGLDLYDASGARIASADTLRTYLAAHGSSVEAFKRTPTYTLQLRFPEMHWLKDI